MEKFDKALSLAHLIKKSKRICFFTGAGISTASGIPDFRSANGVWTNNVSLTEAISLSFFQRKPKEFWGKYKEAFHSKLAGDYNPNDGHLFIAELEKQGKEVVVITQNVDGLHQKAGSSKVYEVHGTVQTATCPKCNSVYDLDYINNNPIPRCVKTNGKGNVCNFILKPNVVLFGDGINYFDEALDDAYDSDLFIVLGSSLEVYPINQIPQIITRCDNIATAIVNKEKTQFDNFFNLVINESINDVFSRVKKEISK